MVVPFWYAPLLLVVISSAAFLYGELVLGAVCQGGVESFEDGGPFGTTEILMIYSEGGSSPIFTPIG